MPDTWSTPIGAHLTREARVAAYGGAPYGGIEPSRRSPNVFIYSDHEAGAIHGYNYDGWNEDSTAFYFTGEGRHGDQELREGNRALLDHEQAGRALRLFVADGTIGKSAQKDHLYIGEFRIDADAPFTTEEAPDLDGENRTVFVFRLLPVGNALRRDADKGTAPTAPGSTLANLVELEVSTVTEFEVPGSDPATAVKREQQLVARFTSDLEVQGRDVKRWKIQPAGERCSLWTDVYDATAGILYEAKGTTTRDAIRRSIGQLLDYRRHIPAADVKLAVLLPHRPSDDLVALLQGLDIGCVYESPPGFVSE